MKISDSTLEILTNFSSINNGITVQQGSEIKTISPMKNIFGKAIISDNFTNEFSVYDLPEFLATVSLLGKDAEFDFGEKSVNISGDGASATYNYADASMIIAPPEKDITMPNPEVVFDIDDNLLSKIVERSSDILKLEIDKKSCFEIARRSRGTPRISNSLLRRVRDFAQIKGNGKIDLEITKFALTSLNVDKNGLDEMDNKILETIIDNYNGGPVGISTLATSLSENSETIEEVYEPFLIQQGFIMRTPRGRQVTDKGYNHLGRNKNNDNNLFN